MILTVAIVTAKLDALKQERDRLVGQANYTAGLVAGYEQVLADLQAPEPAPAVPPTDSHEDGYQAP